MLMLTAIETAAGRAVPEGTAAGMTQTTAHPGDTNSLRIGHHANPDDVRRAGHPTRFKGNPATAMVASVNVNPLVQPDINSGRVVWYEIESRRLEPDQTAPSGPAQRTPISPRSPAGAFIATQGAEQHRPDGPP